uniref:Uncharacterized protein n=1 Tax=Hanusia phi TaxID=3032 RepID=A0A7S0EBR1_9CRYP|mmetsp:Transcript_18769/g.43127  ORF Transcript_18769/g.43127 Transcript_18769/m.43127 type:complete len:276 (+) Transcript_18769:94-921(+)
MVPDYYRHATEHVGSPLGEKGRERGRTERERGRDKVELLREVVARQEVDMARVEGEERRIPAAGELKVSGQREPVLLGGFSKPAKRTRPAQIPQGTFPPRGASSSSSSFVVESERRTSKSAALWASELSKELPRKTRSSAAAGSMLGLSPYRPGEARAKSTGRRRRTAEEEEEEEGVGGYRRQLSAGEQRSLEEVRRILNDSKLIMNVSPALLEDDPPPPRAAFASQGSLPRLPARERRRKKTGSAREDVKLPSLFGPDTSQLINLMEAPWTLAR